MSVKVYDYAIVGGGVAGLYAAFQLLGPSFGVSGKDIVIIEKCSKLGGRLDTDIIKEYSIKEEEGGMRFQYSKEHCNMPLLKELIEDKRLDIDVEWDIVDFYMAPKKGPNNNRLRFRGQSFTHWYAEQNPQVWNSMFDLESEERFKSADDIIKDIYRRLLEHNKFRVTNYFLKAPEKAAILLEQEDRSALRDIENVEYWAFFRNHFTWPYGIQEITLREFSIQALLTAMGYSYGCRELLIRTQGFLFVSLSKGNAGCIIQELITFNIIGKEMKSFTKGWGFLIDKIADYLKKEEVSMHVNMMVKEIKSNKCLALTMENAVTKHNQELHAKKVILALPKAALQALDYSDLLGNGIKDNIKAIDPLLPLLDSVEGIHFSKINLYFPYDWWNEGLTHRLYGPNFTSLPCASVYPFYSDSNLSPNSEVAVEAALTLYCDVNNAQFWGSLQRLGHEFSSPRQEAHPDLMPASEAVVQEALSQLRKVFNKKDVPYPTLTSYRSWDGSQDYGYAIHVWNLGADDDLVRKEIVKPFVDHEVYVCNEAFSDYQGWVEGSLKSVRNVLDTFKSS